MRFGTRRRSIMWRRKHKFSGRQAATAVKSLMDHSNPESWENPARYWLAVSPTGRCHLWRLMA